MCECAISKGRKSRGPSLASYWVLPLQTLEGDLSCTVMAHAVPEVVVTGATGFVASQLIKQLLEKGYTVRGTVRSLQNKDKVQHLEKLGQAMAGHLTLHEADLLQVHKSTASF